MTDHLQWYLNKPILEPVQYLFTHVFSADFSPELRQKVLKCVRTCVHRWSMRIFEHNLYADKEKNLLENLYIKRY